MESKDAIDVCKKVNVSATPEEHGRFQMRELKGKSSAQQTELLTPYLSRKSSDILDC